MSDPDSGDLLLVAARDGAALDRVVSRWKGSVYSIFARTRDAASAAEATADVFDRLRSAASGYDPSTRAETFIHRVIAGRILEDAPVAHEAISLHTLSASAAARSAFLRATIAALPPAERAAFLLTRVAGLSNEAAADALKTPPADLQRQVVHALAAMRAALEPAVRQVPALGPVERHFGPDPQPVPADLDHRLAVRLAGPAAPKVRLGRAALGVSAAGAAAVLAAFFAVTSGRKTSTAPPARPTAASVPDAPAPAILRVPNAPVTVDTAPATEAEAQQAAALFPPAFLLLAETLAGLDPLFAEDLGSERAGPAAPRPTQPPVPPPVGPEQLGDRISFLRHLSTQERARVAELDRAYRGRPEAERVVLWERWLAVRGWAEETTGGLRPLARRMASMTPAQRAALAGELRSLRELAPAERLRRFGASTFARGLTGQERAAAEALLG